MASKYPYIADKSLYAAVMYACKIIRETGHFNRAVNTAAKRYRIDAGRLETALRQRQAAGQTGKKRGKQKWFVVVNQHANYGDYWHEPFFTGLRVERGASKQTKEKILGALLRRGFLKAFVSLADFVNLAIPANSENYFLEAL